MLFKSLRRLYYITLIKTINIQRFFSVDIYFSGSKMIVGQVLFLLAVAFVCHCNGDQESCLRFGGGACCPQVHPTDTTLQQVRCY